MKAKCLISLHNGRAKIAKGRIGGDHKSEPKFPSRHHVLTSILDHEAREELTGDYRHPVAHVETSPDNLNLRNTVVSCGRPEDDDTDGTDHWYIPVDVPKQSGGFSRRHMQTKPPIQRDFRPAKRQLLPIDDAIRRSA